MMKYIVLLYFVLCGIKVTASPSANYRDIVLDSCEGAAHCASKSTSVPASRSASEELERTIERAVKDVIVQTIKVKDASTTPAPAPMMIWSREEIASVVSSAVKQAMKDLIPPLLTPAPASTCIRDIASAARCQERVRNLTRIVAQHTNPHCDEIVVQALAPCQQSVQNLTKSVAELTQVVAQLTDPTTLNSTLPPAHCVSGYEYSNVTGRCYKHHTELVHWPVADERCRQEGGHLAVINSREEASVFEDIRNRTNHAFFIGVYKDSDGRWTTSTGEDVVEAAGYHVWYGSEPWAGEWRYGFMFRHSTIGTLNAGDTLPFVCERAA